MRKFFLLLSILAMLGVAHATPGNNGNGNGQCGVGQQTNGCGGGTPGPVGPQGPKGDKGDPGAPGKDGTNGRDGKDGTNGVDGKDGAAVNGTDGAAGATGATGAQGVAGKDAPQDAVTAPQLNNAISQVNSRIDQVGKNAYAGTAGALAAASIPGSPEAGRAIIGAGAGAYRSEVAIAVGMSYRSKSGRVISKAALSADSRGGVGASVGVAYMFD